MKLRILAGAATAAMLFNANTNASVVWYVNDAATNDSGSGQVSWTNAKKHLDAVLALAGSGDYVKVAHGNYKPGFGSPTSTDTFTIPSVVTVDGSYPGDDAHPDPDPSTYQTYLDGNYASDVTVTCTDTALGTVIKRLIITGANVHGVLVKRYSASFDVRPRFDTVIITNNGTQAYPLPTNQGGGLCVTGGHAAFPTLVNCEISNNWATAGGGIWIDTSTGGDDPGCRMFAQNCTISTNKTFTDSNTNAVGGAGLWNTSAAADPPPTLRDCTFEGNIVGYTSTAGGNGGGALSQGNITIITTLFHENSALGSVDPNGVHLGGNGGAIFATGGTTTLINDQIIKNHTYSPEPLAPGVPVGGGGIFSYHDDLNAVNCLMYWNHADASGAVGGHIACVESKYEAHNLTLTESYGDSAAGHGKGGLYIKNSTSEAHFQNCIFWHNTDRFSTPPDANWNVYDANSNSTIDYSDIGDQTAGDATIYPGTGNIDLDPVFHNASAIAFDLDSSSPCIDAGKADGIPDDSLNLNNDMNLSCSGMCSDPGERTPDLNLLRRVHKGPVGSSPTGVAETGCHIACGCVPDMGCFEWHPSTDDEPCEIPGDMNGDGEVCGLDIQPFVDCFIAGTATGPCICADFDQNGVLNSVDHQCMVEKLLTGTSTCEYARRCDRDCNTNGTADVLDILYGTSHDLNHNGVPDECDISLGFSHDCNSNGTPDEAETDCNTNGTPDDCDLTASPSLDANTNGTIDSCEPDCNTNGTPDSLDVSNATSADADSDGGPDECEMDCNTNGTPDGLDIALSNSMDANTNYLPDECESGGEGMRMSAPEGGGGDCGPRAALAAWDEANPSSSFPTCNAYEFARASFMASLGMDDGFVALGCIGYTNWRSANPYRIFRGSMTLAEYDSICEQMLNDLVQAARNGTLP